MDFKCLKMDLIFKSSYHIHFLMDFNFFSLCIHVKDLCRWGSIHIILYIKSFVASVRRDVLRQNWTLSRWVFWDKSFHSERGEEIWQVVFFCLFCNRPDRFYGRTETQVLGAKYRSLETQVLKAKYQGLETQVLRATVATTEKESPTIFICLFGWVKCCNRRFSFFFFLFSFPPPLWYPAVRPSVWVLKPRSWEPNATTRQ